ncbi:MAG: carboxypeptidase-like regulatory domain-containing protein [Chitinophagaceae bacterium]
MSIKLRVSQPCHEDWNKMTPGEQGRFCAACAKTVIDFSMMSDRELFEYFSMAAGKNVCGRFTRRQLETEVGTVRPQQVSWKYVWNMLVAAVLLAADAKAQSKLPLQQQVVLQEENRRATQFLSEDKITIRQSVDQLFNAVQQVTALVLDVESNRPVAGATVTVSGTSFSVKTDKDGKFVFKVPLQNKGKAEFKIVAPGYESIEVALPGKGRTKEVVYLYPENMIMGKIAISDSSRYKY